LTGYALELKRYDERLRQRSRLKIAAESFCGPQIASANRRFRKAVSQNRQRSNSKSYSGRAAWYLHNPKDVINQKLLSFIKEEQAASA
jgi:hypothetical protein